MNKSIERKMQKIVYNNKGLSKQVMQLKRSLDEVSGMLGGGKKKKKEK